MASRDFKNATIKIQDGTTPTPNELIVVVGEGNVTFTERKNMDYVLDRGVLGSVREGDQAPVEVSLDAEWSYTKGPPVLADTAIDNVAGYSIGDTTITVDTMADVPKNGRYFTIADETNTPEHYVLSATATTITFSPAITAAVADEAVVAFTLPPTITEAVKLIGNASTWVSTDPDLCNAPCVDIIIEYDAGTCGDTESVTLPFFRYEELAYDLKESTIALSGQCNVTEATVVRPIV